MPFIRVITSYGIHYTKLYDSQISDGEAPRGRAFRLGGLVTAGSLQRVPGSIEINFVVTDNAQSIPVKYSGLLPDLFREGQGVIAHGKLDDNGVFLADEVLAKHDENYMPPEVAKALHGGSFVPGGDTRKP